MVCSVSFYRKAIAPRIGFALDVFGTGATILRGGFSKAYDPGSYLTTALSRAIRRMRRGWT